MTSGIPHISVCICTFKRPELLLRLLRSLEQQRTDGLFTCSAVVADNDREESARSTVELFARDSSLKVRYCTEPQQNIALARNKALENASGDFAAFIDDDEFPVADWLYELFQACAAWRADGVLGPVKPHFTFDPPRWVTKGKFFERPDYPSGYRLTWAECRTGNVLFRRNILNHLRVAFRSEFNTAGEDMDFFRRLKDHGAIFVWCHKAIAYESVSRSRCNRAYLLRSALLRGSNFPKHPTHRLRNIAKSLVAVPFYFAALPILAVLGEHVFLKYLIKLLDHLSRLLAFMGLRLVTERPA